MNSPRIGTIILAAGESSRLGKPKQLVHFGAATLLQVAIEKAMAVADGPIAVVLGAFVEKIRPTLAGAPVLIVENLDWREGMGSSLRSGLSALLDAQPDLASVLVMLCDQPLVDSAALSALLDAHRVAGKLIAAAQYRDALGVPAVFGAALFPELLELSGAGGARDLIQNHLTDTVAVPLPQAAIDIDTADDLSAFQRDFPQR